jgi:S-(hydroxymethyl)glutathione dehydrogenase/alcohol dehydrogenase
VCAPADAIETISHLTGGRGVDTAFEVVGRPETMSAAIDSLGIGGQLVLVGAAPRDVELSFSPRRLLSRQQRIVGCIYGSVRPRVDLATLLELCAEGAIPLADLVGETVLLEGVPAVFAAHPRGVRTIIRFQ